MATDPILTSQLSEFKAKKRHIARLFKDRLELQPLAQPTRASQPLQTISTSDISGVAQSRLDTNRPTTSAYLSVYTYKRTNKDKRKRDELVLEFDALSTYEENSSQVQTWCKEMARLLGENRSAKPLLVLVNPKSGAGKASNIFHERALTILSEANVPYVLVLTSMSG